MPKKTTAITSKKKSAKKTSKIEEKNKSISVDSVVYNTLSNLKEEMSKKLGGKITFNMIVQSLLNEHNDLKNMQSELNEIKAEADKTQDYIKNMLELALSSKPQTIMALPQSAPINVGMMQPPPAPPPFIKPPPSPEEIKKKQKLLEDINKKNTEVKSQYINEIKVVFDGIMRKPSEILNITNPKHKDKEVVDEIEGNESKVIDIFDKSVVSKNPDKFKHSDVREDAENV